MRDAFRGAMEAFGRDYARRAELVQSSRHANHVYCAQKLDCYGVATQMPVSRHARFAHLSPASFITTREYSPSRRISTSIAPKALKGIFAFSFSRVPHVQPDRIADPPKQHSHVIMLIPLQLGGGQREIVTGANRGRGDQDEKYNPARGTTQAVIKSSAGQVAASHDFIRDGGCRVG
jgi:hypothetical protein